MELSYSQLQSNRKAYYDSEIWNLTSTTSESITSARTSAQLIQQATFEGWNFNCVWDIKEGVSTPVLISLATWIENGCKANAQEPASGGSGGSGGGDDEEEPTPSTPRNSRGSSGSRASTTAPTSENSVEAGESSTTMTYQQEVVRVLEKQVVTENPDANTNKCEALIMMSRVFEWQVPKATATKYNDVPEWCTDVAAFGTERGIVEGRVVERLGMETPVTRDEVALMLFRELKLQNYTYTGTQAVTFADAPLTPWASEAILTLAKESIIKGFADGTFGGQKNILKQDLGVILLELKIK